MEPMTMMMIGGGALGALNANQNRRREIEQARYRQAAMMMSPWTGQGDPGALGLNINALGGAAQGAALGGQVGQAFGQGMGGGAGTPSPTPAPQPMQGSPGMLGVNTQFQTNPSFMYDQNYRPYSNMTSRAGQ
jgi:hypothetical protein